MEKEFTFKVKTYLEEELKISGSEMGIIELRNMIVDAAKYHANNGRDALSDSILEVWRQLEIPEEEDE